MGKSRNHHKYDDEYEDYGSKKKKWYEDTEEVVLHRQTKHINVNNAKESKMPLDYYD